jgi:hypothetical protein
MDNQEQAQVATPDGVEAQQAPAGPELSITDLQNLRAIVDLASKRGAFSGAELSAVGQVFDRLNTFLNTITQQASTSADETADTEPADEAADTTPEAPADTSTDTTADEPAV